jgi:hypothetical protein
VSVGEEGPSYPQRPNASLGSSLGRPGPRVGLLNNARGKIWPADAGLGVASCRRLGAGEFPGLIDDFAIGPRKSQVPSEIGNGRTATEKEHDVWAVDPPFRRCIEARVLSAVDQRPYRMVASSNRPAAQLAGGRRQQAGGARCAALATRI